MPRHRKDNLGHRKSTSFRLSELHLFGLRLIARQREQSDGDAMERMIERGIAGLLSADWVSELWDEEEAVRWLRVFALPEYKSAADERRLVVFLLAHQQFFWADKARREVDRARAVVLWPHRFDLEKQWQMTKATDHWAAAKEMAKILKAAKLSAPPFGG